MNTAIAVAFGVGICRSGADAAHQGTIDAQKEGSLVYSTNLFARPLKRATTTFRDYYNSSDSFKMQGYIGSSSKVVSRTTQELQANKVTVDWLAAHCATCWKDSRSAAS